MGQKTSNPDPASVADFVDDMTAQLVVMARGAGLIERAEFLERYLEAWPKANRPDAGTSPVPR